MPYLESIVGQINTAVVEALSNVNTTMSVMGISKRLPRDGDAIPAYVDNSGEGKFNAFDDRYAICIYHKCETLSYESDQTGSFGDTVEMQKEIANMSLLCWADRKKIKVTQEALAASVASAFPYSPSKAFKNDRNLTKANIEILSIENNSISVWSREFEGIPYALLPESIYFQISYRIETAYDKNCLELCEEC